MRHELNPRDFSPESIVDALIDVIRAGRPDWLPHAPLVWGAPFVDATVTAFSLRAIMLGAASGRDLYHHELRQRLTMPPDARPETDVWDQEGVFVPYWADGVLAEPKYFSFFQDAPFAAFNPNHRRKWRAHEMLHGAVGFFWREDMTRFEFYLGARLNELLPVVHWYAWDEVFRPRCDLHRDMVLGREFCPACEAAARPYWELDEAFVQQHRDAAVMHIKRGRAHLAEELAVIEREIESLEAIASPRGHLDASSDAIGYLQGHWNRCTSWSFGSWMEGFLADGVDYVSTIEALDERVRSTADLLLHGPVVLDEEARERLHARRHLQDIAYRVLLRMEADGTGRYEDELDPLMHRAADLCWELLEPNGTDHEAPQSLITEFGERLAKLGDKLVMARGFDADEPASMNLLQTGLMTALPDTMNTFNGEADAQIAAFARSAEFWEHGRLDARFATWLNALGHEAAPVATFEAWLAADPRVDTQWENFGHRPATQEALRAGHVRLNATFRELPLDAADAALLFDLDEASTVIAAFSGGEASIIVLNEDSRAAIDAVRGGSVEKLLACDSDVVTELIEQGIIVWLPAVE